MSISKKFLDAEKRVKSLGREHSEEELKYLRQLHLRETPDWLIKGGDHVHCLHKFSVRNEGVCCICRETIIVVETDAALDLALKNWLGDKDEPTSNR